MISMKVYTLYNDRDKPLYKDFFTRTLPKSYMVEGIYFDKIKKSNHIDNDFKKVIDFKTEQMCKSVAMNMGNKIMWLDTDIIFFEGFEDQINKKLKKMNEEDLDVIFLKDDMNDWTNGGFYLIDCNEKMLNYFDRLHNDDKSHFHLYEQDLANHLRQELPIKYDYLDESCICIHCFLNHDYEAKLPIALCHATHNFQTRDIFHNSDKYELLKVSEEWFSKKIMFKRIYWSNQEHRSQMIYFLEDDTFITGKMFVGSYRIKDNLVKLFWKNGMREKFNKNVFTFVSSF